MKRARKDERKEEDHQQNHHHQLCAIPLTPHRILPGSMDVFPFLQTHCLSLPNIVFCTWGCQHVAQSGTTCGWANAQQILSSLLASTPEFRRMLFQGINFIPDVPSLQRMLEAAWGEGYDPIGSQHFGGHFDHVNQYVGATDVVALMRSQGVPSRIVDFTSGRGRSNKQVSTFAYLYFRFGPKTAIQFANTRTVPNLTTCMSFMESEVDVERFPLFLQWDGHSVTIVGAYQSLDDEYHTLIFDPNIPTDVLLTNTGIAAKFFDRMLDQDRYQMVILGRCHSEQKKIGWVNHEFDTMNELSPLCKIIGTKISCLDGKHCFRLHELTPAVTTSVVVCDRCDDCIMVGNTILKCVSCKFDQCDACTRAGGGGGTRTICLQGHELVARYVSLPNLACDQCNHRIVVGTTAMSCTICGFDCCETCSR